MINIPEKLHRLTVEALTSMRMDPYYRLAPSRRLAIYHLLDKDLTRPEYPRTRGWLGLLTARHVLPIWHDLRPAWIQSAENFPQVNQLPDRMLGLARNILRGTKDLKRIWEEANDLWYIMSNLNGQGIGRRPEVPNRAYYAGDACIKALHETLNIEFLERAAELEWTSDEYLQDWERDAAACAVLAEAGGADAGPLELSKRLAFWEWWLVEAIPSAWSLATDNRVAQTVVINNN